MLARISQHPPKWKHPFHLYLLPPEIARTTIVLVPFVLLAKSSPQPKSLRNTITALRLIPHTLPIRPLLAIQNPLRTRELLLLCPGLPVPVYYHHLQAQRPVKTNSLSAKIIHLPRNDVQLSLRIHPLRFTRMLKCLRQRDGIKLAHMETCCNNGSHH